MRDHLILDASASYRRFGTAGPTPSHALLVPSQDVCRYQAKDMPRPTYNLDRKGEPTYLLTVLVATLAVVGFAAAIILIQRIGVWLNP